MIRLDPSLHAALREAAAHAGVSLNEYCAGQLALPGASVAGLAPARALVQRCASLVDRDLLGVVVFGSWARGEATPTSDLDALIVVADAKRVSRELYRRWDEAPLAWSGHPVEPHFVHMPTDDSVGTLWAEASIDGIVLFERGLSVSRRLAQIRHLIASGRLVRRVLHGQPYWAEVA